MTLDQHGVDRILRSPFRLRFELNTGGANVNQFTSAYDRARQLARAAISVERPMAIVAALSDPFRSEEPAQDAAVEHTAFGRLQAMGVATDRGSAAWRGQLRPDDERSEDPVLFEHRVIQLSWDQADILLWNNIASGIGVEPYAPVKSRLVDPETGVVVDAYDDRGMDITALARDPLQHLYRRFEAWLLDYDRPRMASIFGP